VILLPPHIATPSPVLQCVLRCVAAQRRFACVVYAFLYICVDVYVYVCIFVCVCLCMYVCLYVCNYVVSYVPMRFTGCFRSGSSEAQMGVMNCVAGRVAVCVAECVATLLHRTLQCVL